MYKPLIYLISIMVLITCVPQKQKADLLVTNAKIYTVDEKVTSAEAFAVRNGNFIAVGSNKEILDQFESEKILDLPGKTILPGLIDGHCHFYNLGISMQNVDLVGTNSYEEILQRLTTYANGKDLNFIIGRGWDQNDWKVKTYPTKKELDILFPKIPVALSRIDGHAMLVNQAALDLAEIDGMTIVQGGEIIKENGQITGVLIDNAMSLVRNALPEPSVSEKIQALKDADKYCLALGLTTVADAGLSRDVIDLIDTLQQNGELKMKVYAMISVSEENLSHYLKKGIYKTDRLNVRSFKIYADGALGSRGAVLKQPYSDRENHFGAMVTSLKDLDDIARTLAKSKFQMNTHAIGDSANSYVLKTYAKELKSQTNRRWRIEHAQIVDPDDWDYFREIIPSVQPTHATSDMYWAKDRLGDERINYAYAYKNLLETNGRIVLGTDFPVEKVNPMLTFYAAVARKDLSGFPEEGFEIENKLNKEEALKGMTIWPAYANFEENEKGSIQTGKKADFVILDQDIMTIEIDEVPNIKINGTYINGEKVY
ncbi:amidohydrolase [Lutimonas saemankumensis]|uniref:amidohydrolase n=1 Tax=Lutimonas saemankumensis TaxID=483016 RepID=UPI001CD5E708|nr:amidohydrolase [Lutimonas saemankumensis]MCA0932568.1 amidohydrolase [Lutimonas saemankumensis]